jgi:hypothetical protein
MYRRRILCTLHIAVDFQIVLYKELYGWGEGGNPLPTHCFTAAVYSVNVLVLPPVLRIRDPVPF